MKIGQRWYSETETELGLGVCRSINERFIELFFELVNETRTYNIKSAPLSRYQLKEGESATLKNQLKITVEEVKEENGVLFYRHENEWYGEEMLSPSAGLDSPLKKAAGGHADSNDFFNFRYETLLFKRAYALYPAKGLESARIGLIGHQLSLYYEIKKRTRPRIILADEVGLGKTIEAGLIAKNLIQRHLVSSVLVIAPKSLQYQWFIELYKKFELIFKTLGENDSIEYEADTDSSQLLITDFESLLKEQDKLKTVMDNEWDLLIVDEAHRYGHAHQSSLLMQKLTQKASRALYLSATPEALGEENFFRLLHSLNPQKYPDSKSAQAALSGPDKAPGQNDSQIMSDIFRNRRAFLEKNHQLFAQKKLLPYPLDLPKVTDRQVIEAKGEILLNLCQEHPKRKFFAIGTSRQLIFAMAEHIKARSNIKIALFHKEQSLLERDRQAAWFADDEGAQLLLSTQIGSEGRNFEFCSELFLLDLVPHPQLLTQRIGRLDRIGQKSDIRIHLPFVKNSIEHRLYLLQHKGFNLFESFPTGIIEFYTDNALHEKLEGLDEQKIESIKKDFEAFQERIQARKNDYLDAISYNAQNVKAAQEDVRTFHENFRLDHYLEKALDLLGIQLQENAKDIYYMRPGPEMLIPSLPGLGEDGLSFTLSRELALKREDLTFMNAENHLFKNLTDIFTQGQLGNVSMVSYGDGLEDQIYFEFIFLATPPRAQSINVSEYFAPTPFRVLLNHEGKDLTQQLSKKRIDPSLEDLPKQKQKELSSKIPTQLLNQLSDKARSLAALRVKAHQEKAIKLAQAPSKELVDGIRNVKIELDALRIIV